MFDVVVEGSEIPNVDVHKEAGGKNIAMTKDTIVPVEDGYLSLEFKFDQLWTESGIWKNNPKLSGIEVVDVTGKMH